MRDCDERNYPHKELTERIIGCAIEVHRPLGSGLLESAYEVCLADEFDRSGLRYERQVPLPVVFKGRKLECEYRMDFVVKDTVIVELKCVDKIVPIHEAQLLTYMKLANKEVGLLINFHSLMLRDGIIRRALTIPSHSSAFSAPLR